MEDPEGSAQGPTDSRYILIFIGISLMITLRFYLTWLAMEHPPFLNMYFLLNMGKVPM